MCFRLVPAGRVSRLGTPVAGPAGNPTASNDWSGITEGGAGALLAAYTLATPPTDRPNANPATTQRRQASARRTLGEVGTRSARAGADPANASLAAAESLTEPRWQAEAKAA